MNNEQNIVRVALKDGSLSAEEVKSTVVRFNEARDAKRQKN